MNSSFVSTLFNKILIKDIIKEIISYYPRYEKYITKEDYIKLITEMIQTKFNFVIDEPYEVRYYKNLYKLQHNTIPRGPKANSLIWLKSKVNIRLQYIIAKLTFADPNIHILLMYLKRIVIIKTRKLLSKTILLKDYLKFFYSH